jgi:outer membrane receptor protein involved in Fe transport
MVQDVNSGEFFYSNILGANARHMGFELESEYHLLNNLQLYGMLSISNNKWTNNVDAVIYPESNPSQQTSYSSYVKDLYVGGYPMLLMSFSAKYTLALNSNTHFYFIPIFRLSDNQYSNYNPDLRTDSNQTGTNSWKLESRSNFDINFGINMFFQEAFVKSVNVSFNIFNVLNNVNIIDAIDGMDHTSNSAIVWFERERWWSMSIELVF